MLLRLPDERLFFGPLMALSMVATAALAERWLFLDIVLNERSTGVIAEVIERGVELLAAPLELRGVGLRVPNTVPPGPDGLVALRALPGVTVALDEPKQVLRLTALPEALEPTLLGGPATPAPTAPPQASGFGALVNYDLLATATTGSHDLAASALLGTRIFSPAGVFDSSFLLNAWNGRAAQQASLTRLDTSFIYNDPDRLRRYQLGDVITAGLGWTRSLRLGGFQVASNFSLRPDLVTMPVPGLSGVAAVPSTVDVLVNGVRHISTPVDAGPFSVRQLPIVSGNGDITLVVRDSLGREVTRTLPFYASGALLAEGLASYSLEGGWVRYNYGLESDDYRQPAAVGTLRYGLTDWLTTETHGEVTARQGMLGGGAVLALQPFGLFSASAAGSQRRKGEEFGRGTVTGDRGWLLGGGYERVAGRVSLSASMTMTSDGFSDAASESGDGPARRVIRGSLGLSLGELGLLGVAYAEVERGASRRPRRAGVAAASRHTQVISASWTYPLFGSATLYATGFQDLAEPRRLGAVAGISMALGGRGSMGVAGAVDEGGPYGSVQASQSAITEGDLGWRVLAREGHLPQQSADLEYQARWVRGSVAVDRRPSQTGYRAGVQGSVALLGGALHASTPIQDSFAVVDAGHPGVMVLRENWPVGRTDAQGLLLVPALRSSEDNRLSIDPAGLPADAALESERITVRPAAQSGVMVRFGVQRQKGARLRLVDAAGAPLPVGSTAWLRLSDKALPVGHDGETYAPELEPDNLIEARLPDGRRCQARFTFLPEADTLPLLGPIPCR